MSRWYHRAWFIRRDVVIDILERHHLSMGEFADAIGISRSYWSSVVHGRRHAACGLRKKVVAHPLLAGLSNEELWRIEGDVPDVPTATDPPGQPPSRDGVTGGRAL